MKEHNSLRRGELRQNIAALEDEQHRQLSLFGPPNHIGSRRFAEAECDRLAEMVNHMNVLPSRIYELPEGPREPPLAVQILVEDIAESLGPSGAQSRPVPWWCRLMCRTRGFWEGTALASADDPTGNLYMLMYAKGNPHEAMFLELRPQAVTVGLVDHDGLPYHPPMHRRELLWADPFRALAEHEVPVQPDDTIIVVPGLVFEGSVVVTNRAAVDFDVFSRWFPSSGSARGGGDPRPGGVRPRKPSEDIIDELLARCPWLTREDLVEETRHPKRLKAAADAAHPLEVGSDSEVPDDIAAAGLAPLSEEEGDVDAELAEVRELLAGADDDPQEYYKITVPGGRWTLDHTGEVADYVMAKARGGLAAAWALAVEFPRSRRFSMHRYTREGARWLAREFARRGDFFCKQYYDGLAADEPFEHTDATNALYVESIAYLDWALPLDIEGPCFAAVVDIRLTFPAVTA